MTDDNKKINGSQEPEEKESIRRQWKEAMKDVEELGGWEAFTSGVWLYKLIKKSFKDVYERSDPGFYRNKYPGLNDNKILRKLIMVTARNSAILGGVVGAAITTDEIVAIITAGEGGVGLPANIAIAFLAIAGEAVLLTRMQLKLVANIAKLYGVPIEPDEPEDVITIIALAFGGSFAEAAGKAGLKIGGKLSPFDVFLNIRDIAPFSSLGISEDDIRKSRDARPDHADEDIAVPHEGVKNLNRVSILVGQAITQTMIRETIRKEVRAAIKGVAVKGGYKILQRTVLKYAIPVVSMGIGSGWNYLSTRAVGKVARKHFIARAKEIGGEKQLIFSE